jgi:hypothetical protein
VNRKELEDRIWGKSIAYAKKKGIISEKEAEFLLNEQLKEFQAKNPSFGRSSLFSMEG